jgi:hypothetical protein
MYTDVDARPEESMDEIGRHLLYRLIMLFDFGRANVVSDDRQEQTHGMHIVTER